MSQRVLDLFCGAGGFSKGISQAGLDVVLGIDNNQDALRTFEHNHTASSLECDISELSPGSLPIEDVDVIIGGPPCKGFSTMGFRNPDDDRNMLFFDAIEVVDEYKPRIVLFENVQGLKSMCEGDVLDEIIEELESLGYSVSWEVFDAQNFQVPQSRKRMFISGVRDDQYFTPEDVLDVEQTEDTVGLADVVDTGVYDSQTSPANEGRQLRQETALRSVEEPSYTLKSDVPNSLLRADDLPVQSIRDVDSRRLTLDEMTRVQGFPDEFEFLHKTKKSAYMQIGHSVPPLMAKAFGERIHELLCGDGQFQSGLGSF